MSKFLEYKGYMGTVEYSLEDNLLFGEVVGIRSLISYEGSDLESLKKDFEDGIESYLSSCEYECVPPEKPYTGSLGVRISPTLFKQLYTFSSTRNQTTDQTIEDAIRRHILA